jgi:hypothetical protein
MRFALLATLFWISLASSSSAQTPTIKALAPLIDDETWLVARIDLGQFDLAKGFGLLKGVIPEQEENRDLIQGIATWQKLFRSQGGSEIYLVYGGSDFPSLPCILLPGVKGKEAKELVSLFKFIEGGVALTSQPVGDWLVIGTPAAIDQIKTRKPSNREDLLTAWENTKQAPIQLAFSPSVSARKTISELAPELPKDLGGAKSTTLTQQMQWLSFSIDAEPKFTLKLTIKASDNPAANNLSTIWNKLIHMLGEEQLPEASVSRVYLKWFQKVKELLTPRIETDRLEIQIDAATSLPELAGLTRQLLGGPERLRSSNNLKQVMLALHNYHDGTGHLPGNVTDAKGKALLSWRVQILPYIDQEALYLQFKLDEPWDSAHNKKLIAQMPKVYRSPKQGEKLTDKTTYLRPTGKDLLFEPGQRIRLQDIPDGTSNTIAVVETDDELAVIWTKPDDLKFDPKNPTQGLLAHYTDGFLAALGDGSVRFMKKDTPDLLGWFTRNGGEVLTPINPKSIKK